jgi:integrase
VRPTRRPNDQNLIDTLVTKHGQSVARQAGVALAATLRHAYTRSLTDNLPPRVLLPPNPPPRTRALTTQEVENLLIVARADDRNYKRSFLYPLIALLADTGCRISEATGLNWGPNGLDLHADPPVAHINRHTTKTDAGQRTIPLGTQATTALRHHYLATGRPPDGTPVYRDQHGNRVRRNGRTSQGINRIAKAANLEGVTAHTLRHTHITWLVAAGVPTRIAAQRVGQTELLTRTYAHPGQREDQAALTAVENYRNNR